MKYTFQSVCTKDVPLKCYIPDISLMEKDQNVLEEIGQKLTQLRIDAGFTSYEKFAIEYDMSRMAYWKIEKGKTNITIKTLLRLLTIHKMTIQEFFSLDVKADKSTGRKTAKKK